MGPSGNEPSGFVFKDSRESSGCRIKDRRLLCGPSRKNDKTVHPRSKLEIKVRRLPYEGYPALTSSRSENQTKGIIEVGQIID